MTMQNPYDYGQGNPYDTPQGSLAQWQTQDPFQNPAQGQMVALGQLGGYQNPVNGPSIEQMENQRLGMLGQSQALQQLTPDQLAAQQAFQQNYAQSSQMNQQAFQQAQQLAQGGPNTAGARQLALQQGAQNAALQSMARGAGGGARGAAAAGGTAVMAGQQNMGMQAQQGQIQNLQDISAGNQLASAAAQQQQKLAQAEYEFQANQAIQNANYQQGWNQQNDQAALWANTMQAHTKAGDLGIYGQGQNQFAQNQIFNMQQNQAMLGAGMSAAGSVGAGLAGAAGSF